MGWSQAVLRLPVVSERSRRALGSHWKAWLAGWSLVLSLPAYPACLSCRRDSNFPQEGLVCRTMAGFVSLHTRRRRRRTAAEQSGGWGGGLHNELGLKPLVISSHLRGSAGWGDGEQLKTGPPSLSLGEWGGSARVRAHTCHVGKRRVGGVSPESGGGEAPSPPLAIVPPVHSPFPSPSCVCFSRRATGWTGCSACSRRTTLALPIVHWPVTCSLALVPPSRLKRGHLRLTSQEWRGGHVAQARRAPPWTPVPVEARHKRARTGRSASAATPVHSRVSEWASP